MSFNIKADFDYGSPTSGNNAWISTTGNHRRDLATTVINDYGPDILGVQEAFENQMNDLRTALPSYGSYGIGRNNGFHSGEHTGIFYRNDRFTRTNEGTFWLSNAPSIPSVFPGAATFRIASWAMLEDNQAGNQEYFVLNTHWDHVSQPARVHSANLIRQQIDLLAGDRPLIVMGDLNVLENNTAFLDLVGENDPSSFQLLDSYREVEPVQTPYEKTQHGFVGASIGSRIDHILHSYDFTATNAQIIRTNFSGRYPSDHYPVTATLQLPNGDYDGDSDVDGLDFLQWQRDFGLTGASLAADGDSNLVVNGVDHKIWQYNFGVRMPEAVSAIAVPEPTCQLLMLSALVSWVIGKGRLRVCESVISDMKHRLH
ncbi:endonuclease/exonuclease/phosphatase family protein [Adhaeretor mobilis]|nr:endonuclease/exonuclease/phosphatase family protein [Adhaeretor mobilis]